MTQLQERGKINVRSATASHVAAIQAIYAHHVLHGVATFELDPPPIEEMHERWRSIDSLGLPYLVAVEADAVLGFGYCAPHRDRPAYRFSVEDSIYVHPDSYRRGIGRELLTVLIERCESERYRQMVAVIGDSANVPSIMLHRSLGFAEAGCLRSVGWKHAHWLDTVVLQRPLGLADTTPPK
jgi:L-amino acid N-acyltransferase YncA